MTREEAIKVVRNIYQTDAEKEALETLIPELRESEDEIIQKDIINLIYWLKGNPSLCSQYYNDRYDDMLAYLEKQKEQKPASTEDMPYITDEHFYEREPADSFKYKLAEYMTKCCTKKEGPYGYEYGISAETILKMAEEELLKRGVVQKPEDRFEEAREKYQVEWSEEDEASYDAFMCEVVNEKMNPTIEQIKWLRGIRNGLKSLHPVKQEWSEEDELIRKAILGFLNPDKGGTKYSSNAELVKWSNWLKSLRPQPKQEWNTYDKAAVNCIACCLDGQFVPEAARKQVLEWFNEHRRDFLNSSSWKPSEEQMEALESAVKLYKDTHFEIHHEKIVSLYEQLKKLM